MSTFSDPNEEAPAFPPTPARSGMPKWYPDTLASVADKVTTGRIRAVAAVNRELIATYWAVGKELLTRETSEGRGAKVVLRLSTDLKERFPEAQGFSPRNLRYMKAFAEVRPDATKLQQPVATLAWGHNVMLLEKLDDAQTRLW